MKPSFRVLFYLFSVDPGEGTNIIIYITVFLSLTLFAIIWHLLFHSNKKVIQLQVPVYPFFKSGEPKLAEEKESTSNTDDTSLLYAHLINFGQLTQNEFEEMVAESFKHKRWTNIQMTASSNNEGRKIIGIDETGKLSYVEVNIHSNKVDLPIVQKFNTTKSTGRAQRAILVSNSDFTSEAIEYAKEVDIELLNGQKFRELCQNIIDKAPRPDKRTISINQASLTSELHQFIDRAMFSYPNPSSTFISETRSSKITFSPHSFYQFNLWQQFADNTRFWVWDMDYPDHLLVKHPSQEWCVVENRQQRKFTDLDHLTEILKQEGVNYTINPTPPIKKISAVKKLIQQATTTEKSFKDRNNQPIKKICTPDASNINIQTSTIFWESSIDMKAKIGKDTVLKLQLHNGKVCKIVNQDKNAKLLDKTTIMCQECQQIAAPAKYFRKLDFCLACGKVLCKNCGHTETKLITLKSHWCSACWTQIQGNEKAKKKNKEAIKKLKNSFTQWQKY